MSARILRYEVPVDGWFHTLELCGCDILHVGCRDRGVVEFWNLDHGEEARSRTFTVVGTGHEIPAGCRYVGTAVVGPLVWHLLERVSP
jgi:hypothetical protein